MRGVFNVALTARAPEGVADRRLVSNPDFRDTETASRTSRRPSGGITLRVNRRGETYSAQEISDHGHRTQVRPMTSGGC